MHGFEGQLPKRKECRKQMLINLTSSGFVQFNRFSILSSSLVSSTSILIVSLSCASLSTGRLLLKLGVVGELAASLLVLPTKWKFSGVVFDCSKLVNPPGGYILKNMR
jgi:hypothetical protein